jgi:hypothetical protein
MASDIGLCIFCKRDLSLEESVTLGAKGCTGIERAAQAKGQQVSVAPGMRVHTACRKRFCSAAPEKVEESHDQSKVQLRSTSGQFSYRDHCVLCAQPAKLTSKKRDADVFPVRTSDFDASLKRACQTRNDQWAVEVLGRIESVSDLHSADAIYHQKCSINFRTGKEMPMQLLDASGLPIKKEKNPGGRPVASFAAEAFIQTMTEFEEEGNELTTVDALISKMAKRIVLLPPH